MKDRIADAKRVIALLESLPPWITWGRRAGAQIDLEAFDKAIGFESTATQVNARRCHWCTKRLTGRQQVWCAQDNQRLWSLRGWNGISATIMVRDLGMCWHCGEPGHEVDHRIPIRAGGTDHPSNLRLLCHKCHVIAGHEQRRVHAPRWKDGVRTYA